MDGLKNSTWLLLLAAALFMGGVGVGKLWPVDAPEARGAVIARVSEVVRVPLGKSRSGEDLPEVFHRLAGATNAQLIAELERGLDGGFENENELLAFALRWVLEDAVAGADYVLAKIGDDGGSARYSEILDALLFAWSKQEPMGMAAYVARLVEQGHPLAEDLTKVATEAGVGSTKAAVEYFDSLEAGDSEANSALAREMFLSLAKIDPQTAVLYLDKFSGYRRMEALGKLVTAWTERDPVAALEWAGELASLADRKKALGTAIRMLAEQDLGMAVQSFGPFRKELLESEATAAILFELGKTDPKRAMLWLHGELQAAGASADFSMTGIGERILALLPKSPAALYEFVEGIPDGHLKRGLSHLMLNQAPIDLTTSSADFFAEIADLPEGELRSNLLQGVLWSRGVGNSREIREEIREAVAGLEGTFKVDAARAVFSTYRAFASAAEALQFARATGIDVNVLADVQTGNMGDWGDIADAADFFAKADELGKNSLVSEFVRGWATRSPEEALRWVREQPGENPGLVGDLVRGWLQEEPEAASQWALGLENPAEREASAAAVASAMRFRDPQASFAWALEVGDAVEREELIRSAYLSWKTRDRAAADAALARDGVPAELREIFLGE